MKDVCAKRLLVLGRTTWCYLPDGHEGECKGSPHSRPHLPPSYGPRKDKP